MVEAESVLLDDVLACEGGCAREGVGSLTGYLRRMVIRDPDK